MATHFNTDPATVKIVMGETGINNYRLVHALLERGHGSGDIEKLSPRERFDEFLSWEGISGWTDTIIETAKAAGFVVGERRERGPENDEQMRAFLEGVVGAVEADSYTYHSLWLRYADEAEKYGGDKDSRTRYSWDSRNDGLITCVGTIGDMQVWLNLRTATVGGYKLLFYYSSGTFTDHRMVEAWLRNNLPETARGGYPGGYNHTDATNFCNIFFRKERNESVPA